MEIVISVSGGVVEAVHCSQPAIVTVVDWDAEPLEFDVPGFVSVDAEHGPVRAFVSRSGTSTTADLHPLDARAIHLAVEREIIPPVEQTPTCVVVPTSDLATVLAAFRHWQVAFDRTNGGIARQFPHFDRVDPLTPVEIDLLCQRLNFGEPDITPEELESWRTTCRPRFGSEEK